MEEKKIKQAHKEGAEDMRSCEAGHFACCVNKALDEVQKKLPKTYENAPWVTEMNLIIDKVRQSFTPPFN